MFWNSEPKLHSYVGPMVADRLAVVDAEIARVHSYYGDTVAEQSVVKQKTAERDGLCRLRGRLFDVYGILKNKRCQFESGVRIREWRT